MQNSPPAIAPAAPQPPGNFEPPTPPVPPELPFPGIRYEGQVQPTVFQGFVPGMPLTDAQKEQLDDIRSALSDQRISVGGRREEAAEALRTATGADREGLERLVRQLDGRILQIEADIEHTGRLITAQAPVGEPGMMMPPIDFDRDRGPDMTPISIVFTLFVLAPMALAAARLMWKRGTVRQAPAQTLESTQRLERVEQAIDSIAVEVERISEGQRFVTRILTEGSAQSVLNAGQRGDKLGVPRRDAVRVAGEGQ